MKFLKSVLLLLAAGSLQGCNPPAAPGDYKFGTLTAMADKYGTDKGTKGHRYTEVYEYFFYPLKDTVRKYAEIGVETGASLFMARDYFPKAMIYGLDIVDSSKLDSDRIKTFVADQSKREDLGRFIKLHGKDYDLVIDDGGHAMNMQQISFGYLFPYVKAGGIYIIEDVHTSFSAAYGAEPDGKNTTFSMIGNYMSSGKVQSKYMTRAEQDYLTANIDYCTLLSRSGRRTMSWLVKKK